MTRIVCAPPQAPAAPEAGGITTRIVVKHDGATWIEGLRIGADFAEADKQ